MNSAMNGIHSNHESKSKKVPDDKSQKENAPKADDRKYVPIYAFASKWSNVLWWILFSVTVTYLGVVALPYGLKSGTSYSEVIVFITNSMGNFAIFSMLCLIMLDRVLVGNETRKFRRVGRIERNRDKQWESWLSGRKRLNVKERILMNRHPAIISENTLMY